MLRCLAVAALVSAYTATEYTTVCDTAAAAPTLTALKIASRDWLTHELTTKVATIVLREKLGYKVELVDASSGSSKAWVTEMAKATPDYQADLEQWQEAEKTSATEGYIIGNVGFQGQSGVHLISTTKTKDATTTSYDTYKAAPFGTGTDWIKGGDLTTTAANCDSSTYTWCGAAGNTAPNTAVGRYTPAACATAADCVLLAHGDPTWDTGLVEKLITNHAMKVQVGYFGKAATGHRQIVKDQKTAGKDILFYYWTPDPFMAELGSARVSFPTTSCQEQDTTKKPGDSDSVMTCDFAASDLKKMVIPGSSKGITGTAMDMLKAFTLSLDDMNTMMAATTTGGGTKTVDQAACDWVKANTAKVTVWTTPPEDSAAFGYGLLLALAAAVA